MKSGRDRLRRVSDQIPNLWNEYLEGMFFVGHGDRMTVRTHDDREVDSGSQWRLQMFQQVLKKQKVKP